MFRRIGIFILLLAIAVTGVYGVTNYLANVRIGILQNQKTEVERMLEEYSNSLTATKEELNIAITERQELATTVNNYQTEVTELKSQAIIDTEKLATAEANLATAEQALEAKDAEIAKLKQDLETFELICGIANLDTSTAIKPSDFDFTYETFGSAYPINSISNKTSWGYGALSGQLGLDSGEYHFPSFQVLAWGYDRTATHSFSDVFQYMYDFNSFVVSKGVYAVYLYMQYHYSSNLTDQIQTTYNAYDFIEQANNGTINTNNWVDFFIEGNYLQENLANYLTEKFSSGAFTYTQNSVNTLRFQAIYPRSMAEEMSEITTVNLNGTNFNTTATTYHGNMRMVLNEKIDIDKICLFADSYKIVIDNSFKSVCLADYNLSDSVTNASSINISFTENGYIEKLYLPRDIDIANMRDDLKSHIGEVVFLPFTQMQMEYITMSLMH